MRMNTITNLQKEYFDWVYHLVCDDKYYKKLSYFKLLNALYDTQFYYFIERDANVADAGLQLRYRFAYRRGYSRELIEKEIDIRPCSVLEMMVALSMSIEENIMDDPSYGNRIGQWFWNMIVNLGLGSMDDTKFDYNYYIFVINRFMNREYEKNGEGGLFTVNNATKDMRDVEIWYQAMWYLDEFLEE